MCVHVKNPLQALYKNYLLFTIHDTDTYWSYTSPVYISCTSPKMFDNIEIEVEMIVIELFS
jgi:hypothetical protein